MSPAATTRRTCCDDGCLLPRLPERGGPGNAPSRRRQPYSQPEWRRPRRHVTTTPLGQTGQWPGAALIVEMRRQWRGVARRAGKRRRSKAGAFIGSAVTATAVVALPLLAPPAWADCTTAGATVTCASPGTGGFQAGFGVNNLTITNSGSVIVGDFVNGLGVFNGNTVINNGSILAGDGSFGIDGRDNNSIVNNGSISVGGFQAAGIQVRDGNTITNSSTIIAGETSPGIVARDGNIIVNSGTIITANDPSLTAAAILARDGNTITNSGTIIAGDSNGSIGGAGVGFGIAISNDNNVFNTGRVVAGANGFSIANALVAGYSNRNTIVNSGTLDGMLFVISDGNPGSSNSLTNSGLITITDPASLFVNHTFDGTFIQTASGTLALRVSPDTTAGGYDTLTVLQSTPTDTLQLGGMLRAVLQRGVYANTQTYLSVITLCPCFGNTIQGTFAQVTSSSPFYAATATYNTDSVDLTLTRIPFGAGSGLTPNQQAVGNAIESTFPGGNAAFYDALFFSSSSQVLSQISGEGTAAAQHASFLAGNQFVTTMLQQGMAGDIEPPTAGAAPLGYAPQRGVAQRGADAFAAMPPLRQAEPSAWRVWASAFAARQTLGGDGNAFGQTQRLAGGALGLERQASFDLRYGIALGASQGSYAADDVGASGRFDAAHLGVYARKSFGATYLAAVASYAHFWNRTSRSITAVPAPETMTGSFGADLVSGRIELGHRQAFAGLHVTPFVAIEPGMLRQHGYTETVTNGAGLFPLTFAATTSYSFPTFLGAQFDTKIAMGEQTLTPYLRAAWVHEFSPDRQLQASFLTLPGASFTVAGPRAARDAARIEAGARWSITAQTLLFANLTGEFSDRSQGYTANGGLRVTW